MTAKEKYKDTDTFHFYNANPKNRITSDCWVRAICTGLNEPYNDVVREMAEIQMRTGYELTSSKAIEIYLSNKGWVKCKQPRKEDNTKYTGSEFCKYIADKNERYIANIGGHHMVAIVNGKVNDIWNSTCKCVGNFYTKVVDK